MREDRKDKGIHILYTEFAYKDPNRMETRQGCSGTSTKLHGSMSIKLNPYNLVLLP